MAYQINQIFENAYPPEAAIWCNEQGNCYIEQIEKADGKRRFQIKEVPAPTPEQVAQHAQQEMTAKVQACLDNTAQKLGYDNCLSVCSYVNTGVAKFDQEGEAFRKWRSAVWAKGYQILAQVQDGTREVPTQEELFSELPKLELQREQLLPETQAATLGLRKVGL